MHMAAMGGHENVLEFLHSFGFYVDDVKEVRPLVDPG